MPGGLTLERLWYGGHPLAIVLAPLGVAWCLVAAARRALYRAGVLRTHRLPVPVVVVGNVAVGGTGKTPLTAHLARALRGRGLRPGVLCRGYRGTSPEWPVEVWEDSDPDLVGDESVLLAQRAGCPVVAGPDRVAAARALLARHRCDIVVCDDGLQHLRLGRDVEIAVVDGVRRNGNGRCLPAGPLRESASRLGAVDHVVVNGGSVVAPEVAMRLAPAAELRAVADPRRSRPLAELAGTTVHAVCGIGNPERFFATLAAAGLVVDRHPLPDHHRFTAADIDLDGEGPVLMTEKDAVKCRRLAGARHWYLPVEVEVDDALVDALAARAGRRGT